MVGTIIMSGLLVFKAMLRTLSLKGHLLSIIPPRSEPIPSTKILKALKLLIATPMEELEGQLKI